MNLSQVPSDVGRDQSDLVESLLCIQSIERAMHARLNELVDSTDEADLGHVFDLLDMQITDVEKLTRKHFGGGKAEVEAALWIRDSLLSARALARVLGARLHQVLKGRGRLEVERSFNVLTSMLAWEAARFEAIDEVEAQKIAAVVRPIRAGGL